MMTTKTYTGREAVKRLMDGAKLTRTVSSKGYWVMLNGSNITNSGNGPRSLASIIPIDDWTDYIEPKMEWRLRGEIMIKISAIRDHNWAWLRHPEYPDEPIGIPSGWLEPMPVDGGEE